MDPIRPFSLLLRSLRATRKKGASSVANETGSTSAQGTQVAGIAAARSAQPAEQPLRDRLTSNAPWDSRKAREIFVEHTLARELGAELARDPAFGELVANVSVLIEREPRINARLDTLLRDLAKAPAGP